MNIERAWDIFVNEAAQLGGSREVIEKARAIFEPAIRAVLLDAVEVWSPSEDYDARMLNGRHRAATLLGRRACALVDSGMLLAEVAKECGRTVEWVQRALCTQRKLLAVINPALKGGAF